MPKPYPTSAPALADQLIADLEVGLRGMRAHAEILPSELSTLVDLDQLAALERQLVTQRTAQKTAQASASVSHLRAVCAKKISESRERARATRAVSKKFFDDKMSALRAEIQSLQKKQHDADVQLSHAALAEQKEIRATRDRGIAEVQGRIDEATLTMYQTYQKTHDEFLKVANLFESAAVGRPDETAILRAIHR